MKKFIALFAVVVSTMVAATSATAANQRGLVNLNLEGNTVQVPIGIAANVCDVTVAVLAVDLRDGTADCTAIAGATATAPAGGNGGGGNTNQTGLVNVNIEDNVVQIPIAAALNICDVDVAVLSAILDDDPDDVVCTAEANSDANANA